ncbi:type VII secretion protein EssC [Clostridiaceae bacterium]|nr:type VII secretion protein EssC [Clostridiaceae bacterium]RKI17369.1 type VII secretion protein EssC [bacterium 1XD21-70]
MSIVLSVYTKNAYKEFQLPASNNADYEIGISARFFRLKEDLTLRLEAVDGSWRLRHSRAYSLKMQDGDPYGYLKSDDIIQIVTWLEEAVTLVVTQRESTFEVLNKYSITSLSQVTIGAAPENDIRYRFLDLVSRRHAVLKKDRGQWTIEDVSANGIFLNEKKLEGKAVLELGDCISIYGLKIIFLDGRLAVSAVNDQLRLNSQILPLHYVRTASQGSEEGGKKIREKNYFHRAPRNVAPLEEEPVVIEAPPSPRVMNRRPLLMVIGPSFTMMIPMLLGTMLTMYLRANSGAYSGAFMYTGIITSVGSAVLGVFWALMNIRYEKKTTVEEEQKRFEAYSAYLVRQVEVIKEKYEKTRQALLELYPDVEECIRYDRSTPALWSRNRRHEDFLSHRLGLGSLPFQITIDAPKEKFTMSDDNLMQKPQMIKKEYETLYDVPVRVNLADYHVVGLVGGAGRQGAIDIMHILSSQIAANNSYTDVKLVYVYDGKNKGEDWEFAKWLPHVWAEDKKARYVATNKEEASDVFYELVKIFRMRSEDEQRKKDTMPKPYYIMFVADASVLEGELITKYIYDGQESVGLTTCIMAESYEQLPNLCEFVIQKDEEFEGCYRLSDVGRHQVKFDKADATAMERMARTLSGIEVKEVEKGGDIPNALTFFEMFHVNRPEELKAEERWRKNRNYENMKAEVGVRAGGELCYLDVHEKYHGPHGLVAGTTGSGKSETLQTYMLSLALNFSPDDISFFIIDYKGGGMANLFDGLPHLIGQISNLSGNQVRRAMVSIKSENKRRQRVFNEHNVNNINLYTKLYKNGEAAMPVPHLFIIIDEFAELKREESDFMKELISVAQVGRSLGVHLILATQKPSGTVDDNIWSNSKFRLCLRVQDRQDSNDMLHKPDAAYITQAGRCYLQVGNDELYELFQSGYSGAVYDENAGSFQSGIASMVSMTGKEALIGSNLKRKQQAKLRQNWICSLIRIMQHAAADKMVTLRALSEDPDGVEAIYQKLEELEVDYPRSEYNSRRLEELLRSYVDISDLVSGESPQGLEEEVRELLKYVDQNNVKLPEQKMKTQLDAMVEYLAKTAREHGYNHNFQLWMPLLPVSFPICCLAGYKDNLFDGSRWPKAVGEWTLEVPLGLCDDPVNQAQMPLTISFSENGHHAFCGMIVSGKSTLLQTMFYAMVHKYAPDYVNLYAIDFSSHMLSAFEHAPHVGGVIYEDDEEKMSKFFHMMEQMLEDRKKLFKGGNYSQYVRANGVTVPAVIVAIDNYASFREKTNNQYEDVVLHLAHDGVGYGIFLAVTAGGFGSSEIQTKVGDNIKTVVCLQMNDKFQYADAMRVPRVETLPEADIKGRGLARVGERILEFQTALSLEAEDDYQRLGRIEEECRRMQKAWGGRRAKQIPVIPEKPVWSEFEELAETEEMYADDRHLPLGYDMESASPYGIDLSKVYCYLVSGKARTGKTNTLKALIRAAARKGGRVVVIEHGSDDLKAAAMKAEAEYIDSQKAQADFFAGLLEPIKSRNAVKKALIEEGREEEVYEALKEEEKYYIFLADIAAFINSVYKPEEGVTNIRPFLENITEKGKMLNVFFFAGINPDVVSSVVGLRAYENITGYRTGIHLGGSVSGLRYMDFGYLNYTEQAKAYKPGIGLLPTGNDENVTRVVLPLVKG